MRGPAPPAERPPGSAGSPGGGTLSVRLDPVRRRERQLNVIDAGASKITLLRSHSLHTCTHMLSCG